MSIIDKALSYFDDQKSSSDNSLWKILFKLWENAEDNSAHVKTCKSYWNGDLKTTVSASRNFPEQQKTNDNIIKPIVETKLKNMLDAQFTIAVVPDTGAFFDVSAIKEAQAVADIFNEEIKNIFKRNNISQTQEEVGRYGEMCGFGSSQVEWTEKNRPDGEIVIKPLMSENLRWGKGSKRGRIPYFAYLEEFTPAEAKEKYGIVNGAYDTEICKLIDDMTEGKEGLGHKEQTFNVINYVNDENSTAGRSFAEKNLGGVQGNQIVKLVTMFLLDDSVYAPEQNDEVEVEQAKIEYKKAYPFGRMLVFSPNDKHKTILKDEACDEYFKNLGNIDIFNPTVWTNLSGKGEVDDLIPIQDRINGLYYRYREKIEWDFDTIIVDSEFGMEDNSLVRGGVTKVENYNKNNKMMSEPLSNNGIEKGKSILEAIEMLKQTAYKVARVNETMLYGMQQKGTTSGDQVEALQESPMTDIRSQQRNFKNWIIGVAEKCLLLISLKYNDQRLIELSTGIDGAKLALIKQDPQTKEKSIVLLNEALETVKSIKLNDKFKFKVDCVAGTEIPRSRRETADLTDRISVNPIMQSGNLELIDLYLTAQDFPNRRALIKVLREQSEEKANNPPKLTLDKVLMSADIGKNVADIFKSLTGYSAAQGQLLSSVGLDPATDTITTAPAQQVTAKTSATEIAMVAPQQVSPNPDQISFGYNKALEIENKQSENKARAFKES